MCTCFMALVLIFQGSLVLYNLLEIWFGSKDFYAMLLVTQKDVIDIFAHFQDENPKKT